MFLMVGMESLDMRLCFQPTRRLLLAQFFKTELGDELGKCTADVFDLLFVKVLEPNDELVRIFRFCGPQ